MAIVDQAEIFAPLAEKLQHGGCFLVTGKDQPNIMTIGWSTAGIMWNKPVFAVPVRLSRYSHVKLEELGEFTVCVPSSLHPMKKELAIAGIKSGRDMDKIAELGLELEASETISVPRIKGCAAVYECRVVYKMQMPEADLSREIVSRHYAAGDYHTIYYGEILCCHQF
jgi:flavin reductase (DIM6/NTAB) family NADH-FMN oxidoreductase RutF